MIVLLFFTIGYWLSSKRADRITWTLYAIHFVCTIPAIIYLKFPAIFLNAQITNQDTLIKAIELRMKIIPIVFTLFIAGQMLFPIYYARTIKAKRTTT